jgi:hypothetical protein
MPVLRDLTDDSLVRAGCANVAAFAVPEAPLLEPELTIA